MRSPESAKGQGREAAWMSFVEAATVASRAWDAAEKARLARAPTAAQGAVVARVATEEAEAANAAWKKSVAGPEYAKDPGPGGGHGRSGR